MTSRMRADSYFSYLSKELSCNQSQRSSFAVVWSDVGNQGDCGSERLIWRGVFIISDYCREDPRGWATAAPPVSPAGHWPRLAFYLAVTAITLRKYRPLPSTKISLTSVNSSDHNLTYLVPSLWILYCKFHHCFHLPIVPLRACFDIPCELLLIHLSYNSFF